MNQNKRHTGAAGANDTAVARPGIIRVGVIIGIGAGLGVVAGLLFGDLVLGAALGTVVGAVVGAVYEMWRRPVARGRSKPDA